jgi:prepilin-type N-terminal cleavage/methylation domain-containing protein
MSGRRGFTLVELLIALVMMVLVAGGIYSLLGTTHRVTRKQTEISNLQGNLRGGLNLVQNELQEIYTDAAVGASDIYTMTAVNLDYDAMRGIGESCGLTIGGGAIQIRQNGYSGREPVLGRDRLKLFQDRDTLLSSDDVWLDLPITDVGQGVCTVGAPDPSWNLVVPTLLADDLIDAFSGDPLVFAPGPIRTIERMELGLVNDAGKDWLGIRSSSSGTEPSLIPVIGPLTASGLDFKYFDGSNAETLVPSAVKTIIVKLRGVSAEVVTTGQGSTLGQPEDSLLVRVQLRNSR